MMLLAIADGVLIILIIMISFSKYFFFSNNLLSVNLYFVEAQYFYKLSVSFSYFVVIDAVEFMMDIGLHSDSSREVGICRHSFGFTTTMQNNTIGLFWCGISYFDTISCTNKASPFVTVTRCGVILRV